MQIFVHPKRISAAKIVNSQDPVFLDLASTL